MWGGERVEQEGKTPLTSSKMCVDIISCCFMFDIICIHEAKASSSSVQDERTEEREKGSNFSNINQIGWKKFSSVGGKSSVSVGSLKMNAKIK
jgi:hypothetical protein